MHRIKKTFLIVLTAALTNCNQYNRILENVYDNDQAAREWTVGMASLDGDELVGYSSEMNRKDSLNQAIVFGILDKDGWPSNLSDKANQAIWIVINHSDLTSREKYIGLVKAKAEEGILEKSEYAMLNDRILMEQGKPQIYGTQIKMSATVVGEDLTMQFYLWPVENPLSLDSLRATVGLTTIDEYLETSSASVGQEIVWDKNNALETVQSGDM